MCFGHYLAMTYNETSMGDHFIYSYTCVKRIQDYSDYTSLCHSMT